MSIRARNVTGIAAAVSVVALLSIIVVQTGGPGPAPAGAQAPAAEPRAAAPVTPRNPKPVAVDPAADEKAQRPDVDAEPTDARALFDCADAGAPKGSETGVTKDRVVVGATVPLSGHAASFGSEIRFGMEAMKHRINRAGGICGRRLDIQIMDDGADATRGAEYLCAMGRTVFALLVVPFSGSLQQAVDSGCIDRLDVPVVQALGSFYPWRVSDPWVWSVGATGETFARIAALYAYEAGARRFGIVFEREPEPAFVPAARAYNAAVRRLTGANIDGFNAAGTCERRYCGLVRGQSSAIAEAGEYHEHEGDVTALAMTPPTALEWMGTPGTVNATEQRYDAGPALLAKSFATNCQRVCDGMHVWSPFELPLPDASAAARRYAADLAAINPEADPFFVETQAAYVGLAVLADAMAQTGSGLTRAAMRDALTTGTFDVGLLPPISFGPASGARCMRTYDIQYRATFNGWKPSSRWVCA
ncbi:MAG TPA: ABC transporter substrate-binding protein [Actinomycetota bacterium]